MSYTPINIGNQPNDGLGDSGRAGGQKINAMFSERYEQQFIKDGRQVSRYVSDVGNTNLTAYRNDDMVKGWHDPGAKTRWIEGVILDATGFDGSAGSADFDDTDKFFITNEKTKIAL